MWQWASLCQSGLIWHSVESGNVWHIKKKNSGEGKRGWESRRKSNKQEWMTLHCWKLAIVSLQSPSRASLSGIRRAWLCSLSCYSVYFYLPVYMFLSSPFSWNQVLVLMVFEWSFKEDILLAPDVIHFTTVTPSLAPSSTTQHVPLKTRHCPLREKINQINKKCQ